MPWLSAGSVTAAVPGEIFNCIIEISPYYQCQLLRCSLVAFHDNYLLANSLNWCELKRSHITPDLLVYNPIIH